MIQALWFWPICNFQYADSTQRSLGKYPGPDSWNETHLCFLQLKTMRHRYHEIIPSWNGSCSRKKAFIYKYLQHVLLSSLSGLTCLQGLMWNVGCWRFNWVIDSFHPPSQSSWDIEPLVSFSVMLSSLKTVWPQPEVALEIVLILPPFLPPKFCRALSSLDCKNLSWSWPDWALFFKNSCRSDCKTHRLHFESLTNLWFNPQLLEVIVCPSFNKR